MRPLCRGFVLYGYILAITGLKKIKMGSFKSSENIQKKERWPDSNLLNNSFSSATLKRAMKARESILYFRVSITSSISRLILIQMGSKQQNVF